MEKRLFASILLLIVVLVAGCPREGKMNYEELTPEELEMLYRHGEDHLLPKVCEAYARWYLERPEEEWWMEGAEYRKETGERFLQYCERAYTIRKEARSACYLKSYYQSLVEGGGEYLGEFIVYLKGCGNEGAYRSFVEKDARVVAVVEHAVTAFRYLGEAQEPDEAFRRFKKVSALFRRYVEDLKQVEGDVVLFTGKAHELVIVFGDMATTLRRIEEVLDRLSSGPQNPPTVQDAVAKLRWLIPAMERDVKMLGEAIFRLSTVMYSTERINKDLLLEVGDTLQAFKERKETYFKDYTGRLEDGKG